MFNVYVMYSVSMAWCLLSVALFDAPDSLYYTPFTTLLYYTPCTTQRVFALSRTRSWCLTLSLLHALYYTAYLKYGMVSVERLACDARAQGKSSASKFLDELLIWRELSYCFCKYTGVHSFASLPKWAQVHTRARVVSLSLTPSPLSLPPSLPPSLSPSANP
jgi:hypothetical protein